MADPTFFNLDGLIAPLEVSGVIAPVLIDGLNDPYGAYAPRVIEDDTLKVKIETESYDPNSYGNWE